MPPAALARGNGESKAKAIKKQIKKEEKQLKEAKVVKAEKPKHIKGVSPSGLAVANFLIKELGEKDAKKIGSGMTAAAKSTSMKKRLGRIELCVEPASAAAEEPAA
jgi:ribosomal protein L32E